jgi:hypothetical protein
MYRVDQLVGDTAGVHFIFEAGTAIVAIFCLKLDQVTVYAGRNKIGLGSMRYDEVRTYQI